MIAHLVGGPAHGEEITVTDNPHPRIEIPKLEPLPLLPYYEFDDQGDFKPVAGPLETHSYRLLHHDGRYAIYRWEAPRVVAHFQFNVVGLIDDHGELYRKLRNLTEEGEAAKVTSFHYANGACQVSGLVLVDGPADAKAAADASAAVKSVIDRKLRRYQISGFAVDVSDG